MVHTPRLDRATCTSQRFHSSHHQSRPTPCLAHPGAAKNGPTSGSPRRHWTNRLSLSIDNFLGDCMSWASSFVANCRSNLSGPRYKAIPVPLRNTGLCSCQQAPTHLAAHDQWLWNLVSDSVSRPWPQGDLPDFSTCFVSGAMWTPWGGLQRIRLRMVPSALAPGPRRGSTFALNDAKFISSTSVQCAGLAFCVEVVTMPPCQGVKPTAVSEAWHCLQQGPLVRGVHLTYHFLKHLARFSHSIERCHHIPKPVIAQSEDL